jgi:hypothetical protein
MSTPITHATEQRPRQAAVAPPPSPYRRQAAVGSPPAGPLAGPRHPAKNDGGED